MRNIVGAHVGSVNRRSVMREWGGFFYPEKIVGRLAAHGSINGTALEHGIVESVEQSMTIGPTLCIGELGHCPLLDNAGEIGAVATTKEIASASRYDCFPFGHLGLRIIMSDDRSAKGKALNSGQTDLPG